jgi:hypothetical protein
MEKKLHNWERKQEPAIYVGRKNTSKKPKYYLKRFGSRPAKKAGK